MRRLALCVLLLSGVGAATMNRPNSNRGSKSNSNSKGPPGPPWVRTSPMGGPGPPPPPDDSWSGLTYVLLLIGCWLLCFACMFSQMPDPAIPVYTPPRERRLSGPGDYA